MKIEFQNESRFFVNLFAWGEVLHGQGDVTVDREFYREMKKSFLFLVDSDDRPPQNPPIKRQHGDDGFVYGVIVDLFSTDEKGVPAGFQTEGVYIEVAPSPWLEKHYGDEYGLIRDWSPGFQDEWKDPHTGTVLKNVLREASFVSEGHLKNTEKQSPAYALSADGFVVPTATKEAVLAEETNETPEQKPTQLMDEDAEDLTARVAAIEAGQAEIAEKVERLIAALEGAELEDDSEEEETELADDKDKEMAALKKGQDELRKELQAERTLRLQAQANAAINEAGLELEADDRESLLNLAISDADTFNSTVKLLSAKEGKIRELSASGDLTNPYAFSEVGNMGGPAPEPKPLGAFRKLCAEVKESGVTDQMKALKALSAKKAINVLDEADMNAKEPILDEYFPSN